MKQIILYWNLGSQPARAVKVLMDIAKINYSCISLDIIKQQTQTKQFLELNPFGKIPFLIDGSIKISESNAIMVYLCEKYPKELNNYYGNNAQQRAIVNQYLSWYQNTFRIAMFKIIEIKIYGYLRQKKPFLQSQINAAKRQMDNVLQKLQREIKKQGKLYLTSNHPTIADLLVYFELTNYIYYGLSFQKYIYLNEWSHRIQTINQVQAVQKQWVPLSVGIKEMINGIQPNATL